MLATFTTAHSKSVRSVMIIVQYFDITTYRTLTYVKYLWFGFQDTDLFIAANALRFVVIANGLYS